MLTRAMKWASSTPSIIFVLFILKTKLFVNAQHHFMMFEGEVLNGRDLKPIPNVLVVVTQVNVESTEIVKENKDGDKEIVTVKNQKCLQNPGRPFTDTNGKFAHCFEPALDKRFAVEFYMKKDKHIISSKEKKLLSSDFSPGTSPGTSPNTKLSSRFEEYFNQQFHLQKEIQQKHFIDIGSIFAVTYDYEANFWFNWHKFLLFFPTKDADAEEVNDDEYISKRFTGGHTVSEHTIRIKHVPMHKNSVAHNWWHDAESETVTAAANKLNELELEVESDGVDSGVSSGSGSGSSTSTGRSKKERKERRRASMRTESRLLSLFDDDKAKKNAY